MLICSSAHTQGTTSTTNCANASAYTRLQQHICNRSDANLLTFLKELHRGSGADYATFTRAAPDAEQWHWCMHGVWPTDADFNYVLLPNGSAAFRDITATRPLADTAVRSGKYTAIIVAYPKSCIPRGVTIPTAVSDDEAYKAYTAAQAAAAAATQARAAAAAAHQEQQQQSGASRTAVKVEQQQQQQSGASRTAVKVEAKPAAVAAAGAGVSAQRSNWQPPLPPQPPPPPSPRNSNEATTGTAAGSSMSVRAKPATGAATTAAAAAKARPTAAAATPASLMPCGTPA